MLGYCIIVLLYYYIIILLYYYIDIIHHDVFITYKNT